MCNCLCCVGWWWKEGRRWHRCRLSACSSRKAPRGLPGLTSPSDRRIAINSTICLLNIHTADGFGISSRHVMYNLVIRKCTSPPLLTPRLKIFKWKVTTPPGTEPRTWWTRGRHVTIWASAASLLRKTTRTDIYIYWTNNCICEN